MSTNSSKTLIAPETSEKFEKLCCDFLSSTNRAGKRYVIYGRKGQNQHGIDLYSGKFSIVVQCKDYSNANDFVNKIKEDYENAMEEFADFKPIRFIVMTSLPTDTNIQMGIEKIKIKKKTPIQIIFWEDIVEEILKNPVLLHEYYPKYFDATFINVETEVIQLIKSHLEELKKGAKLLHELSNIESDDDVKDIYDSCYQMTEEAKNLKDLLDLDNSYYYHQLNKCFNLGTSIKKFASSLPLDEIPKTITMERAIKIINDFLHYYKDDDKYEQFLRNCQGIINILEEGITKK